jgi:hypothetical protein
VGEDRRKIEELEERIAALERLVRGTARIEPDVLYTPAQVALLLGCGRANVYNLMQSGQLARTALGAGKTGFRVRGADLLDFLDARREGGPLPRGTFQYLKMRRPTSGA